MVQSKDTVRTEAGKVISELILDIFRLNGLLLAKGNLLVEDLGLTSARWQVLGAIALSQNPETVASLSRKMGLARQSVQRLVNEMIEEGLVESRENPNDSRAGLISMKSNGKSRYDAALRRQALWVNQLGRDLSAANLRNCQKVLKELQTKIKGKQV